VRARNADNLICLRSFAQATYPDLWDALQAATPGQLSGPTYIPDGYVLFKVVQRQPPRPEPFEQAGKRARALLLKRLEEERFDTWIDTLRQKYRERIKIFPDRLAKALPETLMDSLSQQH